MSTNRKPIIAVVGSLSKQGRSVAYSLLNSGRYHVRALTGRTKSKEALMLAERGAELIEVPLAHGRKEDFLAAFKGAHGAFLITPGTLPIGVTEFEIGKVMADAAVEAGVQHVVFSSLENVEKITSGKKVAMHFTDKARIEEYIRELPTRSSFIQLAFFYTNVFEYYPPHMAGDTLTFSMYLPENFRAPFVDPLTATGPAVLEIFDQPEKYSERTLPVIGDIISPAEMVETFSKVTGRKAIYASAYRAEEFKHYYPHFSDEFIHETMGMVEYAVEFGYFGKDRDTQWSRRINPDTLNWEQFLQKTGWDGQQRAFGIEH